MSIYTPISPYTTSYTFQNLTSGDLSFTGITSVESDYGTFVSFTDTAPDPANPLSNLGELGFGWTGGYEALISGPSSGSTFTISYNVTDNDPTQAITSIQQLYVVDSLIGPGASLTATEQVYDASGDLITTLNYTPADGPSTSINLGAGYQQVSVVLTINASIGANGVLASAVGLSGVEQNFGQTALSQMAVIGDNVWLDTNGTGIQSGVNAGPGVQGVDVELLRVNGASVIQVASTVTDANGDYQFIVNPGTYELLFVAPLGDSLSPQNAAGQDLSSTPNPITGITAPIVVTAGETVNWMDAGIVPPSSSNNTGVTISGEVFLDNHDNGAIAGEPGVSGVTVELEDGNGNILATVATDQNGMYSFTGQAPGTFQVQFIAPSGYSYSPTGGSSASLANPTSGATPSFTLAAGGSQTNEDAGIFAPAAFTTQVYSDANADGTQDFGETALAGVTVNLLTGAGIPTGRTAVTDANGNVSFTGLIPGSYEVQVATPSGDIVTQSSNVLISNTLGSGQVAHAIEGVYAPASFTTHVYYDANDNGTQQAGEQNLAGVTVTLENGTGTAVATAVTDANGNVTFNNLLPGSYQVAVTTPGGDSVTQHTNVGTVDVLASGQTANAIEGVFAPTVDLAVTKTDGKTQVMAGSVDTYTITVTNNGPGTVNSFNLVDQIPAALLNPVFGTPSVGSYNSSTGLWSGVTLASGQSVNITLTGTIDPNALTTTTTYNAAGNSCDGQENGTATITTENGEIIVTLSSNILNPTSAGQEVSGIQFSLGGALGVVSLGGASGTLINIASGGGVTSYSGAINHWGVAESGSSITLATAGTGAVGGKPIDLIIGNGSFSHANSSITGRNPQIDGTATFILNAPGVTAGTTISNVAIEFGTGPDVVMCATQSGSGSGGSITNTVTVTPPAGTTDSNTANNTASDTDTIIPGVASFTTHVYTDANGNGAQDSGETNLAGVTVTLLTGTGGSTGKTAVTDANGNVSFTGLTPGSYEVAVTTPGGDVITQQSNVGVANALLSGQTANAIEGVYAPVTITGEVFLDKTDTGAISGAPGVGGVTVELENGAGNVLATTTTNSSGLYSFTNEAPGTYQVQFIKPSNYAFSPTGGSSASLANQTNGTTSNFTLSSGQTQANEDAGLYAPSSGGITVIKLPNQVVVGTCGQITYTFDVINTGTTPLTNVQISDNIGTAANPNFITPVLQTATGNGVLGVGQTWVYTATINQSGDYSSGGSSVCHSVSGQDLSGGCTAWLNSSFNPTSCKDGATYTFQDITCTIKGPGCGTINVQVPNACVTFSKNCTQPTTTFNASENCWVTTLPANSSPGSVFLSGLPYQVPSGCNLSGASVTWNVAQSGNNCGSSSLSWQAGCTGYSSFDSDGCNGQTDYNQIGVKVCDNNAGYGTGGSTNNGYGWNYGDSGSYCGGYWGGGWGGWNSGWSGCGSDWNGASNDCAGTPENQYTASNCNYGGSNGYGCYGGSYGYGYSDDDDATCGNGGSGGTVSCGQLGDSSQADTVTVTAATLGSGFSLGDAANYGIIAFAPGTFKGASNSPINGSVGLGTPSCGSVTVQLNSDKITGNLVATGSKPSSTGGTVTGSISGNSSTLSADISALQSLSCTLASETGTNVALSSGMTVSASAGTLDAAGDEVFTITRWANNITINGDGTHNVVLNIATSVTPVLDNVTLTGSLTANQVLFNDQDSDTITGTSGTTFNGTMLAPNAVFNVSGVTVNGHLFGGASNQNFAVTSGATLNTPANTGTGTPLVSTVSASDSAEIQVLSSNSSISLNGTTPTGSLSSLYGTGEKIELAYNPSNTVSLKQIQAGLASVTGSNSNGMAFLEISNNANPYAANASIYFEGEVQTGEKIFADATINQLTNTQIAAPNNHFSTLAGADIYAYVFTSQAAFQSNGAPVQTMAYNVSGSQAMHFGDQIGSLSVIGYVGTAGGHLVS